MTNRIYHAELNLIVHALCWDPNLTILIFWSVIRYLNLWRLLKEGIEPSFNRPPIKQELGNDIHITSKACSRRWELGHSRRVSGSVDRTWVSITCMTSVYHSSMFGIEDCEIRDAMNWCAWKVLGGAWRVHECACKVLACTCKVRGIEVRPDRPTDKTVRANHRHLDRWCAGEECTRPVHVTVASTWRTTCGSL